MKSNFLICFLITIITINSISKIIHSTYISSNLLNSNFIQEEKDKIKTKIFFQAWGKYYDTNDIISKPQTFYQNNKYYNQVIQMEDVQKSDKYGGFAIPNHSSFFIVVYQTYIAIYDERKDLLNNLVDSFDVKFFNPVPEDKPKKGSIKNLGKLLPGFTIELIMNIPNSDEEKSYLKRKVMFSFENKKISSSFMSSLIKVKINEQRDNNNIITYEAIKDKNEINKKQINKLNNNNSPSDGKLVLLQDWSECTLKCGGGLSYQQFMCIPPKKGGKPCPLQTIKSKKCNTQNCPEVKLMEDSEKEDKKDFVKPVIKVERFSKRFNRYSKCLIKEDDVFRFDDEHNKIPARLIMNNQTISIFKDDSYTNSLKVFKLEDTFITLDKEVCCFKIKDSFQNAKFCGFESQCGDPNKNIWAKKWQNDFVLFKTTCITSKQTILINNDDEKNINHKINNKINKQLVDIEENKLSEAKQEIQFNKQRKFVKKIEETNDLGLKAVEREVMIENLIKNDEENKESEKEIKILENIEEEKQKDVKFNLKIKEKELDEIFRQDEISAESDIINAKNEIVQRVKMNRVNLKKQLDKIRKSAKSRRNKLKGKLKLIKQKISKKLLSASKKGDSNNCKKGRKEESFRNSYCNLSYIDDYVENENCKEKNNFCYACCDYEYGTLKEADKDNCLNMCDTIKEKEEEEKRKEIEDKKKKAMPKSQWRWNVKI